MEDGTLEDLSLESEAAVELENVICESILDENFDSKYVPVKIQLIHNATLRTQYEEKKQELIIRGRTTQELSERFGFFVENNQSSLDTLCSTGLCTHESDYNTLGYNCMGVYLCRHGDVCLRHALVKYSSLPLIHVIVCKFFMGRHTTAIPRVASSSGFIEPTQGFDCHVSVIPPSSTDSLQNQFDRSQIYIYDINTLLQPALRPRQVLPYAVVTYSLNGIHSAIPDAEIVTESTTACDSVVPTKLQQIIEQINAKATSRPGQPLFHQKLPTVPVPSSHSVPDARPLPGVVKDSSSLSMVCSKATTTTASESTDGSNSELQRVISQINARLESQERNNRQNWNNLAALRPPTVRAPGPGNAGISISNELLTSLAGGSNSYSSAGLVGNSHGHHLTSVVGAGLGGRTGPRAAGDAYGWPEMNAVVSRGYLGGLAHPQGSITAISSLGLSGGSYLGMSPAAAVSGSRQVPLAVASDLVGAQSLTGIFAANQHLTSSHQSFMPASPYYRAMSGLVDTSCMAAGLDPTTAALLSQVKYVPYGAAASSQEGAGLASGFYPFPAVTLADALAAGTGYTLVNTAGSGVKRPSNDVMLYMVDKKPRFY